MNPSETPQSGDWCAPLYAAQAAKLILYGRALGLGHGEAEDVVQEVFVALMALERPPERPDHYLVRAIRNRAINHRRSLWRRLTREWESRVWFEVDRHDTGAEAAAVACLERLPPDQREVIVLKIWHEHTFEEIGALLKRSPNTVAGRYRYGMERLRACLAGAPEDCTPSPLQRFPSSYEPDSPRDRPLDQTPLVLETSPPFSRA